MKLLRTTTALLLAVVAVTACSSEKKVGSAIDVEKLAEKNEALGGLKEDKANAGGFVGQKEEQQADQNQQQAAAQAAAAQSKAIEEQKERAAVSFAITSRGYDPYVIRVFVGGVITVTNRHTAAASVTADRGEFDSGLIAPGDTWSYEPKTPGKFNFHDSGRPYVVGSLEVIAQ
jgi:plastocyanin